MADMKSSETPDIAKAPQIQEALTQSLDDLLTRYLSLLDQYQNLREELNHHLADVCFFVID